MRVIERQELCSRLHVNISNRDLWCEGHASGKHQLNAIKIIISIRVPNFDILSIFWRGSFLARSLWFDHTICVSSTCVIVDVVMEFNRLDVFFSNFIWANRIKNKEWSSDHFGKVLSLRSDKNGSNEIFFK